MVRLLVVEALERKLSVTTVTEATPGKQRDYAARASLNASPKRLPLRSAPPLAVDYGDAPLLFRRDLALQQC